jgi:ABC-type sugar transport system substrate-binding protein
VTKSGLLDNHLSISRRSLLHAASTGAGALAITGLLPASTSFSQTQAAGRIGFTSYTYAATLSAQMADAFRAASVQLGIPAEVFDGRADPSVQLNGINQMIARGFNGVAIEAVDGGSIRGLARLAQENRVYLSHVWDGAAWFTPWDGGEYYSLHIYPNEFESFSQITRILVDALGAEGTIVRVLGSPNPTDSIRTAAANKIIAQYPGIKLAGELPGDWAPEPSQKAASALLARFPETRGVIAQNDDIATGVIAAIRAIGKVPGKDILVVGTNATRDGANRIQQGSQLATAVNSPTFIGYMLATNLYDRINGWTPEPLERLLTFRAEILTQKNVAPYIARYVERPVETHFDAKLMSRVKSPNTWDPQYDLVPTDLNVLWLTYPKPSNYTYPEPYTKGWQDGSVERITKLYGDHYKIKVLDPSPIRG